MFQDERIHRLCAEPARGAAFWGAGWTTLLVCLALLVDSVDFGHLGRWHALEIRIAEGRVRVAHKDAIVTLIPVADDGSAFDLREEDSAMQGLDSVRAARVVDVACAGRPALSERGR